MDVQRLLAIHFWDDGDMIGTLCPIGPHRSPMLLACVPTLVRYHGNIHSTTWTLQRIYGHLRFIWRPMGSLMCPQTHWEHHRSTTWRTRGHPLVHHILRNLFLNMALQDFIKPLEGPTTCIHHYLAPCEACFTLWATSMVGLLPLGVIICTLFYH